MNAPSTTTESPGLPFLEAIPIKAILPKCDSRYFVLAYWPGGWWKVMADLFSTPDSDTIQRCIDRLERNGWSNIHILKLPDLCGAPSTEDRFQKARQYPVARRIAEMVANNAATLIYCRGMDNPQVNAQKLREEYTDLLELEIYRIFEEERKP